MKTNILCLIVAISVVEGVIYKYNGDAPNIPMYYSKDRDTQFTSIIKIEAMEKFVLGRGCEGKGTCTTFNHRDVYDPVKYGGRKVGSWNTVIYENSAVLCNVYITGLYTPIFNDNATSLFVAFKPVGKPINLEHDGVLALNFYQFPSNSYALTKFYESVNKNIIIFRRGPFKQRLHDKQINNTRGVFALGEESLNGCGKFVYTKTQTRSGWTIKTDILVGQKRYPNQQILFSVDRATQLPNHIFENFKFKAPNDLPEFSFNLEGQKFVLKKENLVQYDDDSVSLDVEGTTRPVITLGRNFLKDYCISLRSSNTLREAEIGLAPIVPLRDDPQWEKV